MPGRVIHVLHLVDDLDGGGSQEWVKEIVRLADPSRFRFTVCRIAGPDVLTPQIEALGTEVIRLKPVGAHPRVPDPRLLARIIRLIRRLRPDVLHLHLNTGFLYGTLARPLAPVPGVLYTVPCMREQARWWTFDVMYRALRRFVDLFVTAVSVEELERYARVPRARTRLLRGAIDVAGLERLPAESNPVLAELGLGDAFPVLLSVGRFHPSKGHAHALSVLGNLVEAHPAARLVILGAGDGLPEFRERVRREGLEANVTLPGFRSDVDAFHSLADIYLRTNTIEASNLSSMRAMAHGLPVVGFDTGGTTETIADGRSGFLVPAGDVTAMTAAVQRLAADPELRRRLGEEARRHTAEAWDIRRAIDVYEEAYVDVASGPGSACNDPRRS